MLPSPARAILIQVGGLTVAAVLAAVLGQFIPLDRGILAVGEAISKHQPWSAVLYPLALAFCNLLLLPGGLLVVGGGFYFGIWKGVALVLAGHLLGAAAAFGITRYFARGWIEQRFLKDPKWRALDLALEREGWKIVFLTQLNPLAPTSLINYFFGATRMRLWPCLGWIALGQLPGMFLYAYLGRLGRFSWRLWREGTGGTDHNGALLLWFGGLVLTVLLTVLLAKIALRLLHEAQQRALDAEVEEARRRELAAVTVGEAA
ncbi:MAG: VTT domain-containing protein [Verrucomicrobia bacterium]|nr:VTT domain-containing protein [Verrucomicrobiota bacterium]